MVNLFIFKVLARNLLRWSRRNNIFSCSIFHILFCWTYLTCGLNCGHTSNKPTNYLLDYLIASDSRCILTLKLNKNTLYHLNCSPSYCTITLVILVLREEHLNGVSRTKRKSFGWICLSVIKSHTKLEDLETYVCNDVLLKVLLTYQSVTD